MVRSAKPSLLRSLLQRLQVALGAVGLTLLFFLALPLIQAMTDEQRPDVELVPIDTGELPPPPPPPPEEEPEPEPEPEEPPPELAEEAPPLDLSMLEAAFAPSLGTGAFAGSLTLDLDRLLEQDEDPVDSLALGGSSQPPRPTYQVAPVAGGRAPREGGSVVLKFLVDVDGRVLHPKVESATHSELERPAVAAIKQWRFEPGRRDGRPVQWPTQLRIQFPSRDR